MNVCTYVCRKINTYVWRERSQIEIYLQFSTYSLSPSLFLSFSRSHLSPMHHKLKYLGSQRSPPGLRRSSYCRRLGRVSFAFRRARQEGPHALGTWKSRSLQSWGLVECCVYLRPKTKIVASWRGPNSLIGSCFGL